MLLGKAWWDNHLAFPNYSREGHATRHLRASYEPDARAEKFIEDLGLAGDGARVPKLPAF